MDNLAVLRFDAEATAYQAFSELKAIADAGAFELHEAAVVCGNEAGALEVKDSVGFDKHGATATGSLIGIVLGILGGPLGILLGWLAGGAVGATLDAHEASGAAKALSWVASAIPGGSTAVLAIVGEPTTDALDGLVKRLGGSVQRYSAAEVHQALDAAKQAEAAARAAATTSLNAAKPAGEHHTTWSDVQTHIKKLFAR